jgi:penicillin-binding protein 2
MANAYGVLGNGGRVMQPLVAKALLEPGTPDVRAGVANLAVAGVVERFDQQEPISTINYPPEIRDPIVRGMQRVIRGPGVNYDFYHKATGENLFKGYPYGDLPIAGKTGTAQGLGNLPWNDSSAFGAFSLDPAQPYSAFAYLEKAGYGSQAAAPVVKCLFVALSGNYRFDELVPADPLNTASNLAAPPVGLRNPSCLAGGRSGNRD